jgi:DNA-binding MarR family transcriptional regulator
MAKSSKSEASGVVPVSDLAPEQMVVDLLASMTRVLSKLSDLATFGSAKLSMPEWLFLNQIQNSDEIARSGAIGVRLGISPQRANQIVESLSKNGFIEVKPASDDARKKDLSLTSKGAATLARVNEDVSATASSVPSITRAATVLRLYSRSLAAKMRPKEA